MREWLPRRALSTGLWCLPSLLNQSIMFTKIEACSSVSDFKLCAKSQFLLTEASKRKTRCRRVYFLPFKMTNALFAAFVG